MNTQPGPEGGVLRQFQDAFAQALLDPDSGPGSPLSVIVRQPGFAVYRNTVMKGCIDALQANYPSVARLVGDEWFRAAAAIFVRDNPPSHPALLDYGAGFAEFLAEFAPAAELPYLAGVAAVDRFWSESHGARDEPPLAASEVARLDTEALGRSVLRPHASARWQWFQDMPVAAIWRRNRSPGAASADEIEWHGEGILLVRPGSEVTPVELDMAACAFLDACGNGRPAADAALAALQADAGADLARLMSGLLEAGAFAGLQTSQNNLLQGIAP